ncbi:hypothetical protein AAVH_31943 [Aphelenchoides avenae]|nr:hypothetical protein AAVH_31943 [Aphelenchus avenae]
MLSLLNNGCARLYRYVLDPVALLRSVLAASIRFPAVAGDAHCFNSEDVMESLQLMSSIGVKEFHILIHRNASHHVLPLFASKALTMVLERADFISFNIDCNAPSDEAALREVRELVDVYLSKVEHSRVLFLMSPAWQVLSSERLIERFLEAKKPADFAMPRSLHLEFNGGIPRPACFEKPTLQNVDIPHDALPRYYSSTETVCDVYHFRNHRTKKYVTVCLGRRHDGRTGYVFMQKGRVLTSEEDIAKTKPFLYALLY